MKYSKLIFFGSMISITIWTFIMELRSRNSDWGKHSSKFEVYTYHDTAYIRCGFKQETKTSIDSVEFYIKKLKRP